MQLLPEDEPRALAALFWQTYARNGGAVLWALHRVVWRPLYLSAALLLVSTLCSFGVPLLLNAILDRVSSEVSQIQCKLIFQISPHIRTHTFSLSFSV